MPVVALSGPRRVSPPRTPHNSPRLYIPLTEHDADDDADCAAAAVSTTPKGRAAVPFRDAETTKRLMKLIEILEVPCLNHGFRPTCKLIILDVPCTCGAGNNHARCVCPVRIATCPHVAQADHKISLERWADILAEIHPTVHAANLFVDGYTDPAAEGKPTSVMSQTGRLALRAERFQRGQSLWHADDIGVRVQEQLEIQGLKGLGQGSIITPEQTWTDDEEDVLDRDEYMQRIMGTWPLLIINRKGSEP